MSTRIIKINKIPRATPIPDIPINFPKFSNLHLELLEVKDKLKKGLPLIPRSKPILKQMPKPGETKSTESKTAAAKSTPPTPRDKSPPKPDIQKNNSKSGSLAQKVAAAATETNPNRKTENKEKTNGKKSEKDIAEELGVTEGEESSEAIDSDMLGESEDTITDSASRVEDDQNNEENEGNEENVQEEPEEFDIYAGLSPEERLIKEREEYLWRFRILKKKYGRNLSVQIPEWNEFSDLSMMKTSYERTIRELYLDDTVETYRTYLVGSWIVMEYVCTEYMNIDLGGFAVQQINMMYKYDSLLIELGEKSCERWTTNLPVEIRLIGMIMLQAAMFYLGKIITDRMGQGAGELFRGVTGQPPAPQNSTNAESTNTESTTNFSSGVKDNTGKKPAGKMRGPKISADDIRARAQKK
jgi:hypothetical protein